jgi:outer membrane protein assembly factor BamB
LTASYAIAQVPCGPNIIPNATLFVNWPQYLYDAAHSGCNPYESILSPSTVGNLTIKWQYGTQQNHVETSPVLANGVVYYGAMYDVGKALLNAVDAGTGNLLWSTILSQASNSSPSVANGIIYDGSIAGIHAVNSAGTQIWYFHTPATVNAPPVIANGVVYDRSADGTVYALNANSGTLIWQYATGGDYIDSGSSPAVASGMVYVGSVGPSDNNIYALDAGTGALIWQYTTGDFDFIYSSPTVANGKVYIASLDKNVYALDAKTGALVWKYPAGDRFFSSPAVARGVVYISSESNFYALNGATGALLWNPAIQFAGSTPAVANGVVYVCGYVSNDGSSLFALDANTGAVLKKSGPSCSDPVVANGVVYVATTDGVTALHLPGQ